MASYDEDFGTYVEDGMGWEYLVPSRGERMAKQWNRKHTVGTKVIYQSYAQATPVETITRSAAWVLPDDTPVIKIEGFSGCVWLAAITVPLDVERDAVKERNRREGAE